MDLLFQPPKRKTYEPIESDAPDIGTQLPDVFSPNLQAQPEDPTVTAMGLASDRLTQALQPRPVSGKRRALAMILGGLGGPALAQGITGATQQNREVGQAKEALNLANTMRQSSMQQQNQDLNRRNIESQIQARQDAEQHKDSPVDKMIDEGSNQLGQKVLVFQKPDGGTYTKTVENIVVQPKPEAQPIPGRDVPLSPEVEAQRKRMSAGTGGGERAANDPNQLLSPTEAASLGVPYGAKRSDAFGKKPIAGRTGVASEGERRAFGFYERANDAEQTLKGMEDNMSKMGVGGQARLKYAPNILQSDEGQIYNQAQRQFVESTLRQVSGAAINPSEYESYRKMFFVQPGDTKDTIERKRKARANALRTLKMQAGRAYVETYGDEEAAPNDNNAPPPGAKVRDYSDVR